MTSPVSPSAALVVGASGGIGAALAAALAARGTAAVYGTARDVASPALQALCNAHPAIRPLTLDVTDEKSVARAAEALAGTHLELLVNTVGVLHDATLRPERRLADLRPEALARSFAVNATGAALLAKHFEPHLSHGGRAVLATLSARVGSITDNRLGGWYAYRAAKAAQNQITRCVAVELARRAPALICVALHPGTVDTALSKPFQSRVRPEKLFSPALAAAQLLAVIDGLTPAQSGGFFAWDGSEIPW